MSSFKKIIRTITKKARTGSLSIAACIKRSLTKTKNGFAEYPGIARTGSREPARTRANPLNPITDVIPLTSFQPKTCTEQHQSKTMKKILAFYFKLSQYVIHRVQNNIAINIAAAVKWMAINEECLIWSI